MTTIHGGGLPSEQEAILAGRWSAAMTTAHPRSPWLAEAPCSASRVLPMSPDHPGVPPKSDTPPGQLPRGSSALWCHGDSGIAGLPRGYRCWLVGE